MVGKAFIYVLTNKAFSGHDWVKIGYAADVEKRRRELSTTALPYPYEIFATYEVPVTKKMPDKTLHKLITSLNPSLRLTKNREFFEMTPEAAYDLLRALAVIHDREDKLVRYDGEKPSTSPTTTPCPVMSTTTSGSLPKLKDFHDVLSINTSDGKATMTVDTGSFVVKAGSVIKIRDGVNHPASKAHVNDLSSGLLDRKGSFAILTVDKSFNSASMAAVYVVARNADGWKTWRGPDGRYLDDLVQRNNK